MSGLELDPPTTKEVLGDHMYQKVAEIFAHHFLNARETHDGVPTISKVTGMLLERPTEAVCRLLGNCDKLVAEVAECLDCLQEHKKDGSEPAHSDIPDILFEKVAELDASLAPHITGMLLELDVRTQTEMLRDDQLLAAAVDKSREAIRLSSSQHHRRRPSPQSHSGDLDPSPPVVAGHDARSSDDPSGATAVTISRDDVAAVIYGKASILYPDCPSQITGMILEMDASSLYHLTQDVTTLESAIHKAFTAWTLHGS